MITRKEKIRYSLGSYKKLERTLVRGEQHFLSKNREIMKIHSDLKILKKDFKVNCEFTQDENQKNNLLCNYKENRQQLITQRNNLIENLLEQYSQQIILESSNSSFDWGLTEGKVVKNRQTYRMRKDEYFKVAALECAEELKGLVPSRFTNRNVIVEGLVESLKAGVELKIIRCDIKNFFNTIDHSILEEKINQSSLSKITKKMALSLIRGYSDITGQIRGLPQGIGLSSVLADFYINDIDLTLLTSPHIVFQARYVDDIIIVAYTDEVENTWKQLKCHIDSLNLEFHTSGRKYRNITIPKESSMNREFNFNYLGYNILIDSKRNVIARLTNDRVNILEDKITQSFNAWYQSIRKYDSMCSQNNSFDKILYYQYRSGCDGLLLDRIKFLAGNTRLSNNKSDIIVGTQYNYSLIREDDEGLIEIETFYNNLIDEKTGKASVRKRSGVHADLEKKLRSVSFVKNYANKKFYCFTADRQKIISRIWS